MGISSTATLASLCVDGHGRLPAPRSDNMVQLHIFLTTLNLSAVEDSYEWSVTGTPVSPVSHYSTSQVYKALREQEPDVPWAQCVWIKEGIPRQSFLTWLFVLNRSPTRDRLAGWGLQTDTACLLCNQAAESRDHIFYLCPYSWEIWKEIARRCQLLPLRQWNQTLLQMQSLQGGKIKKRLILIGWQSTTYWIWQERNKRLHTQQYRSPEVVTKLITRQITDLFLSYRFNQLSSGVF